MPELGYNSHIPMPEPEDAPEELAIITWPCEACSFRFNSLAAACPECSHVDSHWGEIY